MTSPNAYPTPPSQLHLLYPTPLPVPNSTYPTPTVPRIEDSQQVVINRPDLPFNASSSRIYAKDSEKYLNETNSRGIAGVIRSKAPRKLRKKEMGRGILFI